MKIQNKPIEYLRGMTNKGNMQHETQKKYNFRNFFHQKIKLLNFFFNFYEKNLNMHAIHI